MNVNVKTIRPTLAKRIIDELQVSERPSDKKLPLGRYAEVQHKNGTFSANFTTSHQGQYCSVTFPLNKAGLNQMTGMNALSFQTQCGGKLNINPRKVRTVINALQGKGKLGKEFQALRQDKTQVDIGDRIKIKVNGSTQKCVTKAANDVGLSFEQCSVSFIGYNTPKTPYTDPSRSTIFVYPQRSFVPLSNIQEH